MDSAGNGEFLSFLFAESCADGFGDAGFVQSAISQHLRRITLIYEDIGQTQLKYRNRNA